jgi:hypothetical protein
MPKYDESDATSDRVYPRFGSAVASRSNKKGEMPNFGCYLRAAIMVLGATVV